MIAILDTNCDPDQVDYPIPGNDDAIRSVQLLTRVLADAVADGLRLRSQRAGGDASSPAVDEPLAEWEQQILAGSDAAAEAPAADAAPEAPAADAAPEAPAADAAPEASDTPPVEASAPVEAESPVEPESRVEAAAPEQQAAAEPAAAEPVAPAEGDEPPAA